MSIKSFSCSIQNLKLIPPTPNKKANKCIITSTSPLKADTISYINTESEAYTNKKYKLKILPSFTYKGFSSPNNRYNYTMFSSTDLSKIKKSKNLFPIINLSLDKNKYNKINKSENGNSLFSSIYNMIQVNKHNIKKENLIFIKEKKSEIQNMHKNLMKRNELFISLNQKKELNNNYINNNEEGKKKRKCLSLTEGNKEYFNNEYNNICKNKLKEKDLIEKEINSIGKQFSWIKEEKNNNDNYGILGVKKNTKEENNALINSLFSKRMKVKDPILEINQTSNFPIIADDKKLISNLWKKDMMKYCEYTLDTNNKKNKKFLSDLLDVYD